MNIRTFWKARTGTNLNKFTKSSETASSVILTNAPDSITEAGTPFTAAALNSIEERIENNRMNIDSIVYGVDITEQKVKSLENVYGMTSTASGDVYACVSGGDIYKQTGGTGDFIALSQTSRNWFGMTSTASGDVYAAVYGGDIYKQTGGTGDFIALNQTNRNWFGITSTPSGDVYATVAGGDIYKQTGGTGDFVALGQTVRFWSGITSTPSGDVYATVASGDIYKQTGGTGDFIALNQTNRNWNGMTSTASGDVYACVIGGDIYKQTGGTGNFVALGLTIGDRLSITQSPTGALLTATSSGIYALKYYMQPRQNLLINSNFDFWQEATSLSSGTGLRRTSDGGFSLSAGTTYSVSRQSFTVGQTSVHNGPKYYKRFVTSSVAGAGNFCLEAFEAECLESTSGKTISFSLWIKADATKNISVEFDQRFGTGGSSSVTGIGVKKQQITTSWAKYTFTAEMPSISGKTLGSTPGVIRAYVWFDAGSNFNSRTNSLGQQSGTFDIAQVKLEIGDYATDWEPYNLADELIKCQRYCQTSYDLGVALGTATSTGCLSCRTFQNEQYPLALNNPLKAVMAYSPAITWYSTITGAINSIYCENPPSDIAVNDTLLESTKMTGYPFLSTGNTVNGGGYYAHFVARAYL